MMPGMRAGWIVIVLVGCGSSAPPPPVAPKGPTACARAADSMVQTMLDRLAAVRRGAQDEPTEAADALRNLIRERCEQDAWSAEATQCLIAMKTTDDGAACAAHMTEAQQAALVRDQQAASGKTGKAQGNGSPAAPRGGGE